MENRKQLKNQPNTSRNPSAWVLNGLMFAAVISIISTNTAQAAIATDPGTVGVLRDRQYRLIIKERNLLREYDDLLRQIDDLRRRGENQGTINDLHNKLDTVCGDLKRTRLDIRDIQTKLL